MYRGMYHSHCGRGFSRLFWFLLGAGSAAWYIRSHHDHDVYSRDGPRSCTWRHRRELDALRESAAGNAGSPHVHAGAPTTTTTGAAASAPVAVASGQSFGGEPAGAQVAAPTPSWPADRWRWEELSRQQWVNDKFKAASDKDWEEHQERFRQIAKQAENKVTEISEATLDTILATAAELKAKLAEHRVQQEKLQAEELARAEEIKRSSSAPRWV